MVELVTVTAGDGAALDGAFWLPGTAAPPRADACLLLHGATSHAFGTLQRSLAEGIAGAGVAVLSLSTRGHDIVSRLRRGSRMDLGGVAFEDLDEAPLDVRAGVGFLRDRGFERIAIAGHSLGAVKCIYTQSVAPFDDLAALITLSPPRLSYQAQVESVNGPRFLKLLAQARDLVDAGRPDDLLLADVPIPSLFTASLYLKKYGPEDRYDLARHLPAAICPSFVLLGTQEIRDLVSIGATAAVLSGIAERMPALRTASIEGADHSYTGKIGPVVEALTGWLRGT